MLVAAAVLGLVVLVAAGLTRASVGGTACADRVAVAALRSTSTGDALRDACTRESQGAAYTALASVMGLVLISGLLSRQRGAS